MLVGGLAVLLAGMRLFHIIFPKSKIGRFGEAGLAEPFFLGEAGEHLGLDADAIGGGLRPVEPPRPGAQTGPVEELAQLRGIQLAATASVETRIAAGETIDAQRMTSFEVDALRQLRGLDPK